jgi:hypothetical protein
MKLSKIEVMENFTLEKVGDYILMYDSWAGDPNKNIIKMAEILNESTDFYFCEGWELLKNTNNRFRG